MPSCKGGLTCKFYTPGPWRTNPNDIYAANYIPSTEFFGTCIDVKPDCGKPGKACCPNPYHTCEHARGGSLDWVVGGDGLARLGSAAQFPGHDSPDPPCQTHSHADLPSAFSIRTAFNPAPPAFMCWGSKDFSNASYCSYEQSEEPLAWPLLGRLRAER
jgi:hypothetical protein